MNLQPVKVAWSGLPSLTQAGLVVLAVILVGWAGASTWGWWSSSRAAAKYQADMERLQGEHDTLIRQAEALEQGVLVKEAEIAAKEDLIKEANARIQAADARIEEAIRVYNEDLARVDAPVSLDERRRRLCAVLAAEGRPCQ